MQDSSVDPLAWEFHAMAPWALGVFNFGEDSKDLLEHQKDPEHAAIPNIQIAKVVSCASHGPPQIGVGCCIDHDGCSIPLHDVQTDNIVAGQATLSLEQSMTAPMSFT